MAPKATWKGNLKISLISFPVRLYSAVSTTSKVSFHQLHKGCGQRVKYKKKCPVHGELDNAEIARGYEFEKGRYVVMDEADFEKVRLETTHTIEIREFVEADALSPLKIKAAEEIECEVVGYVPIAGREEMGALALAVERQGRLEYLSKVGTGFTTAQRRAIYKEMETAEAAERLAGMGAGVRPRRLGRRCRVRHFGWTTGGQLRAPVFVGWA